MKKPSSSSSCIGNNNASWCMCVYACVRRTFLSPNVYLNVVAFIKHWHKCQDTLFAQSWIFFPFELYNYIIYILPTPLNVCNATRSIIYILLYFLFFLMYIKKNQLLQSFFSNKEKCNNLGMQGIHNSYKYLFVRRCSNVQ